MVSIVLKDLSREHSLEALSSMAGLSARTARRLFSVSLGISLAEWRQQALLLRAVICSRRASASRRSQTSWAMPAQAVSSRCSARLLARRRGDMSGLLGRMADIDVLAKAFSFAGSASSAFCLSAQESAVRLHLARRCDVRVSASHQFPVARIPNVRYVRQERSTIGLSSSRSGRDLAALSRASAGCSFGARRRRRPWSGSECSGHAS